MASRRSVGQIHSSNTSAVIYAQTISAPSGTLQIEKDESDDNEDDGYVEFVYRPQSDEEMETDEEMAVTSPTRFVDVVSTTGAVVDVACKKDQSGGEPTQRRLSLMGGKRNEGPFQGHSSLTSMSLTSSSSSSCKRSSDSMSSGSGQQSNQSRVLSGRQSSASSTTFSSDASSFSERPKSHSSRSHHGNLTYRCSDSVSDKTDEDDGKLSPQASARASPQPSKMTEQRPLTPCLSPVSIDPPTQEQAKEFISYEDDVDDILKPRKVDTGGCHMAGPSVAQTNRQASQHVQVVGLCPVEAISSDLTPIESERPILQSTNGLPSPSRRTTEDRVDSVYAVEKATRAASGSDSPRSFDDVITDRPDGIDPEAMMASRDPTFTPTADRWEDPVKKLSPVNLPDIGD